MRSLFNTVRVTVALFCGMFGFFLVGCETDGSTEPSNTENSSANASADSTPAATTPTTTGVLNDDPRCKLSVRKSAKPVTNVGQVHYINRVLTCVPFEGVNPVCVQYNDTRRGEVTAWKDLKHKGEKVVTLPSDRGIDIVVVWFD